MSRRFDDTEMPMALHPRIRVSIGYCLTASNQKEAVSRTVWSWHMKVLLRISTAWKVWDFDFLRGLAPGRLDGFSIERYETIRVPFGLSVAGFES